MKKIFKIQAALLLILGAIYFSACEKVYDGTYDRYNPTPITLENVNLKYDSLVSYPIPDVLIKSAKPTYDAEGPVDFGIDTVIAVNDTKFQYGKFKIDRSNGVVTYDNKSDKSKPGQGTISPGEYRVSVSILNVNGFAIVKDAYKLIIKDVPVVVSATPDSVNVEYLYSGTVSTLSYVPAEGIDENDLGKVTFELGNNVTGFSINKNEIVKSVEATPGKHKLSILVKTKLGVTLLENFVTVVVGTPPTLKYVQQNGVDSLAKVTLSPWSTYTTAPPVLSGMSPEGWDVILPDGAPQQLADALSVNADGSVVVAPDMNIPEGDYLIGVKVGYGSEWVPFKDLFTLHIEIRWDETTPVLYESFQDESGNPALSGNIYSVYLTDAEDHAKFKAVAQKSDNAAQNKLWDVRVAKMIGSKNTPAKKIDAVIVIPVDLTANTDVKSLRTKFGSAIGYGANALNLYQRTLAYTYTALNDGDDVPSDWTVVMEADNADWPSAINWGKGFYYDDFINNYPTGISEALTYLPQTSSFHYIENVDNTKTVYLCLRVTGTDADGKNSVFFFDDILIQGAKAFPGEEE